MWQRTCANLWGPLLEKAGCQLVITAHQHKYRYDGPVAGRSWAHIVGGGPDLGVSSQVVDGKRVQMDDESRFPAVVEGFVEGGRLRVRVHNVLRNSVAGEFSYAPRCVDS
ncbi:MAG: hypothetical protein K6G91_13445, partial [Kiritimatiellae bacterium]|nr:hypothetical protein [Kiritimatiellia bacterium]